MIERHIKGGPKTIAVFEWSLKGGQKKVAFLCRFFRPTSDVNISKSVYDAMPNLKPEIVYPFNRQYSMSAAKVCWVNSVACN